MKKLHMILPLALILCCVVGCQEREATTEQNRTLVTQYFKAVESGDSEAAKEIFSPDFVLHHTTGQDLSLEETVETVKRQNEQSKVMFPDLTFINEDTIVTGNKAVLMFTFKGIHTGGIEGIPATGNAVEGRSITIFRFENGKIAEGWQESNGLRLYLQLGYELRMEEEN